MVQTNRVEEPLSTRPLEGKVAIVTGAGGGIGRGIARALVSRGAAVTCAGRSQASLDETVAQFGQLGEIGAVRCDVSSTAEVEALVAGVHEQRQALDILVCSHGVYDPTTSFVDLTDDQWDEIMAINVRGTFVCCRAAARRMMEDGRPGRIVVISSTNGIVAEQSCTPYNTSKAALHGLTQSMAYDLAEYGITVNAVAPGWIRSPMSEPFLTEDILSGRHKVTPVGRIGMPKDIADAVAWLVHPDSSYVTGAVIVIDGGQTAVQFIASE
jgi:NAD(P)-dependent dehydrogenase (short-subunit alcohol dehydrogenase family)